MLPHLHRWTFSPQNMYHSTMVDAMINNRVNYLQRVLIIHVHGIKKISICFSLPPPPPPPHTHHIHQSLAHLLYIHISCNCNLPPFPTQTHSRELFNWVTPQPPLDDPPDLDQGWTTSSKSGPRFCRLWCRHFDLLTYNCLIGVQIFYPISCAHTHSNTHRCFSSQ